MKRKPPQREFIRLLALLIMVAVCFGAGSAALAADAETTRPIPESTVLVETDSSAQSAAASASSVETVQPAEVPAGPAYAYTLADGQATITHYAGAETELVIPEEIDGYPVVGIGAMPFANEAITGITIPASVTSIGDNPFWWCGALARIDVSPENPAYESLNGVLYN
jgi:hypothetical protein